MPRYIVRMCKGREYNGDDIVAVLSAEDDVDLFHRVDEYHLPIGMEWLELPRRNMMYPVDNEGMWTPFDLALIYPNNLPSGLVQEVMGWT